MNTKLHAITPSHGLQANHCRAVDTSGRPIRLFITAGQVSDYTGAAALMNSLPEAEWLLVDRGYDADWFREVLVDKGTKPCIPRRKSRKKTVKYPFRDIALQCTDGQWTSAATNDVIAPLVTLLRNALPGSDRENVRQAQGLAAHRNPLGQITNRIPLRNRPRSNHHILVMSPDPNEQQLTSDSFQLCAPFRSSTLHASNEKCVAKVQC
jgi:transposase